MKTIIQKSRAAALVAMMLMAQSVSAQPPYPGAAPGLLPVLSEAQLGPEQLIRQGMDRLAGFLARSGQPAPGELRAFIERELAFYFDFAYMARWATGPLYPAMDEAQRSHFATQFRQRFLSALTRNLGVYTQPLPQIEVYRARPGRSPNEVMVRTRVVPTKGYPVQLDFRFYRSRQGWKCFDVIADGSSAMAYYRNHYRNLAGHYGPEALTI